MKKVLQFCEKENIKCTLPRVKKLIEFMNDTAKKLEYPTKQTHINLLYVNWSYCEFPSNSYLEAYSLLYNDMNGLLKYKNIGINMGVAEEVYDKITAIIVYTNSLNSIVFSDFRYLWSTRCFAIMPNINLDSNLLDYKLLLKVTDMDYRKNLNTPHFMCDLKIQSKYEVSSENIENIKNISDLNEIIENYALK